MEHQIANCMPKKEVVWPVIQKGDRNAESNAISRCPDVWGHPMSMPKLSMLSTATTEEENPDHSEWDTDVK